MRSPRPPLYLVRRMALPFSHVWVWKGSLSLPRWNDIKHRAFGMLRKARKFFRTPKGLLILILLGFLTISAPGQGLRTVAVGLGSASLAAGLTDLLILRLWKKVWEFPSGALLTALIIGMVLRAESLGMWSG
jgi:hypothetical protein